MAWVVNKSQRVINVGGVMIPPVTPTEVDDSVLENPRVKEMMEDGELEKAEAPSDTSKPAAVHESGQQQSSGQQTNHPSSPAGGHHPASGTTGATGTQTPQNKK